MSLWMGERLQNRGEARSQTSAALHLQPLSICLFMSSLSFSSSSLPLCVSHRLSNISCFFLVLSLCVFLIFPDFSTLTWGLLPPKECPARAKAILWLFFERVYFMPLYNIKSRFNQWQFRELNFCLYFWFYYASNQFCFTGKSLLESFKCSLMAFFICCSLCENTIHWQRNLSSINVMWMASEHKGS